MVDENSFGAVQEFGPRLPGVNVVKPIIIGNWAKRMVRSTENGRTHMWRVYLRLYNNEDPSGYIRKVQFKLHESFGNQKRILEKPPYELEETGWGEFDLMIKIYFADPSERPVTLYHHVRLFITKDGVGDFLVHETYDELVFSEPSSKMYNLLMNAPLLPPNLRHNFATDFEQKKIETIELLSSAKKTIETEIEELRRRLDATRAHLAKHKPKKAT